MYFGDLRQMLTDWASRVVRFTRIASAASDGSASIEGRTIPGGPEAPNIRARLMFPFGVRSVPPAGVDAAVVHAAGASARGIVVACDSTQYGPSDLVEGETALYCITNAKAVWIDKDGRVWLLAAEDQDINITASGSGVVRINGGSLEVARRTDPIRLVAGGKLAKWMGQVELALAALGGAAPTPLVATFLDSPDVEIKAGASRLLG